MRKEYVSKKNSQFQFTIGKIERTTTAKACMQHSKIEKAGIKNRRKMCNFLSELFIRIQYIFFTFYNNNLHLVSTVFSTTTTNTTI